MAYNKPEAASELERRKSLRIRLRRDLTIEAQKYEGRTFFVLKDPVSLRYYRLKENEHYLLQYLNGTSTLEDAQKAYEEKYRPERLKLEDLEAFAQQLIKAGLAQNESPKAGKQLFENRKKRRRQEWMQTFTNILYIKVPALDPDRILRHMTSALGWIFTAWFSLLSVVLMLGAILLVATHFETFRSKLPNYHEFFQFKTVVYLWGALAVVKVIHEFGHGLSCKRFGGEVHEMGLLFLCLSPAMYCNVSDAWKLPNKWHRIIISFAGIYVELVIAAIATFIWWRAAGVLFLFLGVLAFFLLVLGYRAGLAVVAGLAAFIFVVITYVPADFLSNMSLSLMIVCSVSTVVFNANPLMRYDGYYVLADWLEIPNLREKSNRFLSNLCLDYCLGVEVQPEPYMQMGRKILFVTYAIVSYVYKWIVTFGILWFMYHWLRPYKLEVISTMLAMASLVSLVGWPIFRLGKNLYRRGRLPDMKRWRVLATSAVLAAAIFFVFCVPVPISRIRGTGLVQPWPENTSRVFVRHKGILEKLNVRDGQWVHKGEELAVFRNFELEAKLEEHKTDAATKQTAIDSLTRLREETRDLGKRSDYSLEIAQLIGKRDATLTEWRRWAKFKKEEMTQFAPRDGIVSGAPSRDDIGKTYDAADRHGVYEKEPREAFLTITDPSRLRICLPVETPDFNQLRENCERKTPRARQAFEALNRRVTVHFEKTPFPKVLAELSRQVPAAQFQMPETGLPAGLEEELISYDANRRQLYSVLDDLLGRLGIGFVIRSEEGDAWDGRIVISPGRERGLPEGKRMTVDLPVTIRIQGLDNERWQGKLMPLPESEAAEVPMMLSNRAGGPVAIKGGVRTQTLVPQTQQYLVYIDIVDPGKTISPGAHAQVKIHLKPETCASWLWRKINDLFDLGLM